MVLLEANNATNCVTMLSAIVSMGDLFLLPTRASAVNIDLHSHTTASDGALSPMDLLLRAKQQGVDMMAITDHDTVAGYRSVRDQWQDTSMQLIAGVELSCLWHRR